MATFINYFLNKSSICHHRYEVIRITFKHYFGNWKYGEKILALSVWANCFKYVFGKYSFCHHEWRQPVNIILETGRVLRRSSVCQCSQITQIYFFYRIILQFLDLIRQTQNLKLHMLMNYHFKIFGVSHPSSSQECTKYLHLFWKLEECSENHKFVFMATFINSFLNKSSIYHHR